MNPEDAPKEIPESIFADDDGTADARLAQTLIRHSSGRATLAEVVDALAYARVLVPVVASGDLRKVGKHGLEQDEVASTGVVALEMPDGRRALPIFTDVDAMRAWKVEARPVPAEGPRAALAAVAEQWSVLVLNPGMESTVIPRPAVWALAQGEIWRPAVAAGAVDPEVADAIAEAIAPHAALAGVAVAPGDSAEVAVTITVRPGLTPAELEALVADVQADLARANTVAQRVDSLQIRIEPSAR